MKSKGKALANSMGADAETAAIGTKKSNKEWKFNCDVGPSVHGQSEIHENDFNYEFLTSVLEPANRFIETMNEYGDGISFLEEVQELPKMGSAKQADGRVESLSYIQLQL